MKTKRLLHSVWKSQKKSYSTLRAKRAPFTFWVDKSSLKSAKNGPILANFWKPKACGQTELPDRSKIGGKCQNSKIQMWHFDWFSNTVCMYLFPIYKCISTFLQIKISINIPVRHFSTRIIMYLKTRFLDFIRWSLRDCCCTTGFKSLGQ